MSLLHATLLGFSLWTLALLMFTVGVHRWSQILLGRARIHEFPANAPAGPEWYRRATRAHANCIENLPVYAAIVVTASSVGAKGSALDVLAVTMLSARIVQSLVHVAFVETPRSVSVRFSFYAAQIVVMLAMSILVIQR